MFFADSPKSITVSEVPLMLHSKSSTLSAALSALFVRSLSKDLPAPSRADSKLSEAFLDDSISSLKLSKLFNAEFKLSKKLFASKVNEPLAVPRSTAKHLHLLSFLNAFV